MSVRILVSVSPGEVRTALLSGDTLREVWVERPARPDGVGDLHRGRVLALAPAMSGAFVALAGNATGFLPDSEAGADGLPLPRAMQEGMLLGLLVTRAAQGGKGPRVSARLTAEQAAAVAAAPSGAPRRVARGPLAAERLALAHGDAALGVDDPLLAARLGRAVGAARVGLCRAPAFDEALEAEIEALTEPHAALPGGGRLLIHPTPALTAIDVDAGSVAGTRDPGAQARLNMAALPEIARQLRLRNLAGPILLDLAGLSVKRRAALEVPLRAALAGDRLVALKGLGPLGLFEMLRRRVHPPLHEVLGWPPTPLTHGLAALRRAVREAAASQGRALSLRAAPAVLGALRDLPGALEEATAALARPLALIADPSLAPGSEVVEATADGR